MKDVKFDNTKIQYEPDYQYCVLKTGIRLSYVCLGERSEKKIVLIHGALDNYIAFSQVGCYFAQLGYQVYIPELRGHGHSDKPEQGLYTVEILMEDIYDWMNQLGLEDVHIVGHSMGSMIAQRMAICHPEKVHALTLLSTSISAYHNPKVERLLHGDDQFAGICNMECITEEYIRSDLTYTNFDPAFQEAIFKVARMIPLYVWHNTYAGLLEFDNTDQVHKIKCPIQMIWGSDDDFFDREVQNNVLNHLDTDYLLFQQKPGCTHDLHCSTTMGTEITMDIERFINQISHL